MPKSIGILYHPMREESLALAAQALELVRGQGRAIWQGPAEDEAALRAAADELELLITLGGDGTIVRGIRAVAGAGVPVLGVNLGRLGFLAEVEPEDLARALPAVLAGQYAVDERMLLHVEVYRGSECLLNTEAVNDVVLGRGAIVRAVRISVEVDGHYVLTQTADAIIASTPTGSTAYCLAAGGPIVAPDMHCIVLTPVAPHLSMAHGLVVPGQRRVRLRLIKGLDASLTVDGQMDLVLQPGDELRVTASDKTAHFVRFGSDGHFYETVLRRLRWPDRGPIP